jgi:UDPglucose--hexose-1-phosphate uridylyltransferase
MRVAAELVRRARASDPSHVHHVAGMNFLNPGGSSVPHPHLQVHARGVPYSGLARAMSLAADFHARTGKSFFDALVEHERRAGARHVGRTGAVEWIAAWAPAHQREIWGILPGTGSLAEASEADLDAFGEGMARVVSFYEETGNHPFTFAFQSSPQADRAKSWALHVKICSRPAFKALYANYDTWFAPKFLGDEAHLEAPEAYAERLRGRWGA